jgi:AcrR family transcriptional regulator
MADLVDALGIASARIYAAFGSKEKLFREAVELYEAGEGGFATRALMEEPTGRRAMERMLREAIILYTQRGRPRGCMVVSSATNCTAENDGVREWLEEHRRNRARSIITRIQRAVREGDLQTNLSPEMLGDYIAAFLSGVSVQARDGLSRERLLTLIPNVLAILDR